jgi:hypothetical protein
MCSSRFFLFCFSAISAMVLWGCLDRQPAPVCPVPIEVSNNNVGTPRFDGVDLLVVIDNSGSMEQEQQTLSTGFFTLINSLTKPLTDGSWDFPAVENMRVAIVSSDMGFQYGEERSIDQSPQGFHCLILRGDDGAFLRKPVEPSTPVVSGVIRCETDGGQCPAEYECINGTCTGQSGVTTIPCDINPGEMYVETEKENANQTFTERLACLARQGTDGCAFEQQLEASVRGLERDDQKAFISDTHLLAVLVVTDEEDCSIKDPALFNTRAWDGTINGKNYTNVACNVRVDEQENVEVNEDYLFDTTRYRDKLLSFKNNQSQAVVFAAIVGVPKDTDACQGSGDELKERDCLGQEEMKLLVEPMPDSSTAYHFRPACIADNANSTDTAASARPGRRFVKVAQDFGSSGYVYSICKADWSPAMERIAQIIAAQIIPACYAKQLDWEVLSESDKKKYNGCENCGVAKCDVLMERYVSRGTPESEYCPAGLYEDLSKEDKKKYESMITGIKVSSGGSTEGVQVLCPVPKLPAALDCATARQQITTLFPKQAGWFYCENMDADDTGNSCNDNIDNDGNGSTDCSDPICAQCSSCGGSTDECREGCRYGVSLTDKVKDLSAGSSVKIQCLQRFNMTDQNCREDSPFVCADKKDNDGNGVWDCDNTLTEADAPNPHLPEPACCPMEKDKTTGKCVPKMTEIRRNCSASDKLSGHPSAFWQDANNAKLVDACVSQKEYLDCEW